MRIICRAVLMALLTLFCAPAYAQTPTGLQIGIIRGALTSQPCIFVRSRTICDPLGTIDNTTGAFSVPGSLAAANNLSDLPNPATARTNLGLGALATENNPTSLQVTTGLGYIPINPSSIGIANGIASLDNSGYVPLAQINPAITGGLTFVGAWNATTNVPGLTSGVGVSGQYYVVSVAGSTTLDGVSSWSVGDELVFASGHWTRVPLAAPVQSVATLTGAITASGLLAQLGIPAGASGSIQLNVGGTLTGVAMSGDATISAGGVLAIANAAVTSAKMASGAAVANIGFTPLNKAGDTATGPVTIAPSTYSATVSPLILTQPSGSPGSSTVPSSNLGLQQFSGGTSSGWQPFWNGGGTSFNRVDATSTGAIGQGRIYAPLNFIWSDTVDNGTSDGSVNDPHSGAWGAHQPSNGINTVSGAYYEQNVHAGYAGVRETLRVNLIVDGAPALWNTNPNLVGIRDRVSVLTNQGGAPGALFANAKGAAFAYNPEVYLASGATDMLEVALFEGNIGINTGASARMLFGSTMVKNSDVAGSVFDAAYEVGAGGATPWQDGLLLTDVHSRFPINTTGSIVRVAANVNGGTPTFTNGMDVSAASVTGCVIKWATGCLSGSLSLTGTSPGIEHGSTTVANTPFFDWHSSGNNIDYDVRLAASGGNGSVGNGLLTLLGNFALGNITGSTQCLQVDSAGLVSGTGDACNPTWSASAPTPTSTGTLPTAATANMHWRHVGKTYDINLLWNVTNLGPGTAGAVQFPLPNSAVNQSTGSACSFYNSSTGSQANMSAAYINPGDTKLTISFSGLAAQGYVASCRFEST